MMTTWEKVKVVWVWALPWLVIAVGSVVALVILSQMFRRG